MAVDLDFERMLHRDSRREPVPAGSLFDSFADAVLRRVDAVIAGRDCPWAPTPVQVKFLTLIRSHQGRSRAISLENMANRLGVEAREMKAIVRDLRLHFGVQIGSGRAGDSGYWLLESAEDCLEATGPMYRQAISELLLVAHMRKGAQTAEALLRQIAIDFESGQPQPAKESIHA